VSGVCLPTVEHGRIDRLKSSIKVNKQRSLTIYEVQMEGQVKT
jgi:hypothetical protein